MTTDYRPNVKLALSTIAIKWNAAGKPLDYLLDASDADLVIDSLLEHGWSVVPTEIADAAHEVVTTHTEVQELTATLDSFCPRFVQLDDTHWVNPQAITGIVAAGKGGCDLYDASIQPFHVNRPASEVVALLTAPEDSR